MKMKNKDWSDYSYDPYDPENQKWTKPCMDRSHDFPSMLYIPPGEIHTHTCPSCGNKITVVGRQIFC